MKESRIEKRVNTTFDALITVLGDETIQVGRIAR